MANCFVTTFLRENPILLFVDSIAKQQEVRLEVGTYYLIHMLICKILPVWMMNLKVISKSLFLLTILTSSIMYI